MIDVSQEVQKAGAAVQSATEVAQAQTFQVTDQESYSKAAAHIAALKSLKNSAEASYKPIKQNLDATKKMVLEAERSIVSPIEQAINLLTSKCGAWRQAEDARIRKEQIEAEERRKKQEEDAKLMQEIGLDVPAPAPIAAPIQEIAKGGLRMRTYIKWRVIDESLIPTDFKRWVINNDKIQDLVTSLGMAFKVAGIEVYEETKTF